MASYQKIAFASLLFAAAALEGCQWDSSLYDKFVVVEQDEAGNETNRLIKCPADNTNGELIYIEVRDTSEANQSNADEPDTDEPSEDEPDIDEPSEDEPNIDEPSEDEPDIDEPSEDEPDMNPHDEEGGSKVIRCALECPNNEIENCFPITDVRCKTAANALKYGLCPNDTACMMLEDSRYICGYSECRCAIEHSSRHACINDTCLVVDCDKQYHPNETNTACEADDDSSCGHIDCHQLEGWEKGTCNDDNHCEAEVCKEGYHIYNTQVGDRFVPCARDTAAACGKSAIDCNDRDGVNKGAIYGCQNGECYVEGCKVGYHFNASKTDCNTDTYTECGSSSMNCTELAGVPKDGAGVSCTPEVKCRVEKCNKYYHRTGSDGLAPCEADTKERCGENKQTCSGGTPYCTFNETTQSSTCSKGCGDLSLCDNQCVDLKHDIKNCGSCNNDCTILYPNTKVECDDKCIPHTCNDGFELVGTQCLDMCRNTQCAPRDFANSEAVSCEKGSCIIKKCKANHYLYNNKCYPNDKDNCGSHGNSCQLKNMTNVSSVFCSSNATCDFTCKPNFFKDTAQKQCICKCPANANCVIATCAISSCKPGFHISKDGKSCNPDNQNACGSDTTTCPNKCTKDCNSNNPTYQYCIAIYSKMTCRSFNYYSKTYYDYKNQFKPDYDYYNGAYYIKAASCDKRDYYRNSACIKTNKTLGICKWNAGAKKYTCQ